MDGLSCKINFKISVKPSLPLTRMAISEVDGTLSILVDDYLVFDEDYICLAEFAAKLDHWLKHDYPKKGFIFESMDYEESPILQAELSGDSVILSSVWMEEDNKSPIELKLDSFIEAAKLFLKEFEMELPNISSIY